MVSGQKCHLESQRRKHKCMTEKDKQRAREVGRFHAQKNKEKISSRQKMIREKARKYRDKCKCE